MEGMENPLVLNFVTLTVFSLMLAIGVNHSPRQLSSLWRQPALLLRSLLAVVVLVPAFVFLLLSTFGLPPAVATGLVVLAAVPGAPMMYKRTQMAAGDPDYAASLQLTLALLAVVVAPLTLAIFYPSFDLLTENVAPAEVARQVGRVTFLPVVIGLILQLVAPELARRAARPIELAGGVLFIAFALLLIALLAFVPDFRGQLNIGLPGVAAIIVMVAASLGAGHALGGPPSERRAVLAVACIARNAGLAFFIAGVCDYGNEFAPTVLTYVLLGSLLGVPYSAWSKRQRPK